MDDSAAAVAGVPLDDRADAFMLPLGGVAEGGIAVGEGVGTLETPPVDIPVGGTEVYVPLVGKVEVRVRVVVDVPPPRIEEDTPPLLDPPPESGFMDMVQAFTSLNRLSPFAPVIGVITTVQLWVKTPASVGIC